MSLLIVLACSISLHAYLAYEQAASLTRAATLDTAGDRLDSLSRSLERFAIDARDEVAWMSDLIAAHASASPVSKATFEKRLKAFVASHREYCHVYYEPIKGQSFRFVADDYSEASDSIASFIDEEPQFRNLLDDLRSSSSTDIQISGLLDYTFPDGTRTPFIHIMAPVEYDGIVHGYLALTLDLKYVLDEIRGAERVNEVVFLADHDGKFLASKNGKELSSYLPELYPEAVVKGLFSDEAAGNFTEEGRVFSYRHIVLPGVRQGPEADNYWVLASASDERDLFHWETRLMILYGFALATSLTLIAVIGSMVFRIKHEND